MDVVAALARGGRAVAHALEIVALVVGAAMRRVRGARARGGGRAGEQRTLAGLACGLGGLASGLQLCRHLRIQVVEAPQQPAGFGEDHGASVAVDLLAPRGHQGLRAARVRRQLGEQVLHFHVARGDAVLQLADGRGPVEDAELRTPGVPVEVLPTAVVEIGPGHALLSGSSASSKNGRRVPVGEDTAGSPGHQFGCRAGCYRPKRSG